MFPPIIIDISDVVESNQLAQEQAEDLKRYVLDRITDEYMMKWNDLVNKGLHGTRQEYQKAMFVEYPDENSVIIGLTPRESKLALMIEDGWPSFDEKIGFKNSDKAKNKGTDKWYLTIPFRWATSEAVAESSVFSNQMPKPIQQLVKVATKPITEADIPVEFRGKGSNPTSGYEHKYNVFHGLKRVEASSTTNEKRGQYMSFRRVSENSDPGAFIHPGFKAKRFMEQALNDMDLSEVVDISMKQFFNP